MSDTIVLATIDGDPGSTFHCEYRQRQAKLVPEDVALKQYEKTVNSMLDVFDSRGLTGKVTWFLNECDVGWSKRYPHLLQKLVERGDTPALHTHCGGMFGSPRLESYQEALDACGRYKTSLEAALGQNVFAHRCGCIHQSADVYRALKALDFRVLSDVKPGAVTVDPVGRSLDNSSVPVSASPWRHDEDNWLDWRSRTGPFLQLPVTTGGLEDLEEFPGKVLSGHVPVACWVIHPHELQRLDGEVDGEKLSAFSAALQRIDETLSPTYKSFQELLHSLL